jgi:acyl-CoA reductase-like NAD-dependent aldehyde dehydrogenase
MHNSLLCSAELPLKCGFYLAGEWVTSATRVAVHSPYDQGLVGETFLATEQQLEQAIAAADSAFAATRKLPAHQRRRMLREVSQAIAANTEKFVRLMVLEAGKPAKAARAEVERAAFTFEVAAEEAGRIAGEYLPLDLQAAAEGKWGLLRRFPVGPIAAITPFNFPLNLVAHKLAPAMACGCPVVLKPAPQTPFCSLLLAELIERAGWPQGGLSVLPLANETAGRLVADDRLKLLSFTGSAAVGWQLKAQSGKKKVVLELGGNAAVIVHSDADLEQAASRCAAGGFGYAGQSCISVQRIRVARAVFNPFLDRLVAATALLKTGDPADATTDVGPLIRSSDAGRVAQWIEDAVAAGARLVAGGRRNGSLIEPAILTGTSEAMKLNSEEVFGPVVTVEPYDDVAAAISEVNRSRYGLQAGIFTNDAALIFRAFEEIEAGGVTVNEVPTFRIDHMPYGGVKDSGMGREGVRYAIEEMTERRLLVVSRKL